MALSILAFFCLTGVLSWLIPPFIPVTIGLEGILLGLLSRFLFRTVKAQLLFITLGASSLSYLAEDPEFIFESLAVIGIVQRAFVVRAGVILSLLGSQQLDLAIFVVVMSLAQARGLLKKTTFLTIFVTFAVFVLNALQKKGISGIFDLNQAGVGGSAFSVITNNLGLVSSLLTFYFVRSKNWPHLALSFLVSETGILFYFVRLKEVQVNGPSLGWTLISLGILMHASRNLPRNWVVADSIFFVEQVKVLEKINWEEFCKDKLSVWLRDKRVCLNGKVLSLPENLGGYQTATLRGVKNKQQPSNESKVFY